MSGDGYRSASQTPARAAHITCRFCVYPVESHRLSAVEPHGTALALNDSV